MVKQKSKYKSKSKPTSKTATKKQQPKYICQHCGTKYNNSKLHLISYYITGVPFTILCAVIIVFCTFSIITFDNIFKASIVLIIWRYLLRAHIKEKNTCPKCKSHKALLLDTPMGKKLHKDLN